MLALAGRGLGVRLFLRTLCRLGGVRVDAHQIPFLVAAGTKAAITPMDWAAMILLCFVLPAVLSVLFCEAERKLGWIKDGDLKLN